jgi:hypothetical protein
MKQIKAKDCTGETRFFTEEYWPEAYEASLLNDCALVKINDVTIVFKAIEPTQRFMPVPPKQVKKGCGCG